MLNFGALTFYTPATHLIDKSRVLCRVGVSSEPEVTVRELTPEDAFMILASDGVWEFIDNQEAVDIVGQYETVEEGCRQVRGPWVKTGLVI